MGKQGVIFYIIEEATNNARKHANALHIWVRLRSFERGIALLEIEDDGLGFDVEAVNKSYDQRGSLGMINLRERTELVNGLLTIDSAPGLAAASGRTLIRPRSCADPQGLPPRAAASFSCARIAKKRSSIPPWRGSRPLGLRLVDDAVVAPRDERKPEWWILARIEQELGFKSVLDAGPEPDLFGRIGHMLKSRGHSLEELRASPHGIQFDELEAGRFYDEWLQTPDGRVDCCPPLVADGLARAETICRELEAERADQLKLITRRDAWMHISWYHNVEKLKRPGRLENPLHMNPDDAQRLGLTGRTAARAPGRS